MYGCTKLPALISSCSLFPTFYLQELLPTILFPSHQPFPWLCHNKDKNHFSCWVFMLKTTPDLHYFCLTGTAADAAKSLNPGAAQPSPGKAVTKDCIRGLAWGCSWSRAALPLLHQNPCQSPGSCPGITQAAKGHVLQPQLNSHTPQVKKY